MKKLKPSITNLTGRRVPKVLFLCRDFALRSYCDSHIDALSSIADLTVVNIDDPVSFGGPFVPRSMTSVFKELRVLKRLIAAQKPDLLVSIGPKIGLLVSLSKLFNGVHNIHWFTGQIWEGRPYRSVYFWIDGFIFLMSNALGTDAVHQKRRLERYFAPIKRDVFVPFPFSLNGISGANVRSKSPSSGLRLLYLGRLAPEKGVDFIADVAEQIVALENVASLTIVGPLDDDWIDGPAVVSSLQAIPAVSVKTGFFDKTDALRDHDIILLASEREGLPMVLVEAIAYGLHPICTYNSGTAEVLAYFKLGSHMSDRKPGLFLNLVRSVTEEYRGPLDEDERLAPLGRPQFVESLLSFYSNYV